MNNGCPGGLPDCRCHLRENKEAIEKAIAEADLKRAELMKTSLYHALRYSNELLLSLRHTLPPGFFWPRTQSHDKFCDARRPIIARRAPQCTDKTEDGTLWFDDGGEKLYILMRKENKVSYWKEIK